MILLRNFYHVFNARTTIHLYHTLMCALIKMKIHLFSATCVLLNVYFKIQNCRDVFCRMRTYVSFGLTWNVLVLEHHPSLDLRSLVQWGWKVKRCDRAFSPRLLRDESSPDILTLQEAACYWPNHPPFACEVPLY